MNEQTPSTLQTMPKDHLFGIIVFLILLGTVLLNLLAWTGNLERRVTKLEAAVFTEGAR